MINIPLSSVVIANTNILYNQVKDQVKDKPYYLPKQFTARYETKIWGLSGRSVLNFKQGPTSILNQYASYEAELNTTATILFKRFNIRYGSKGTLDATGIHPLWIEEKRVKGTPIVTTVNLDKQTALSSQAGTLPYQSTYLDILSIMFQLGIESQKNANHWANKGSVKDFTVYRPSGTTLWRLQSQGLQTIRIADKHIETIYIKRIPIGNPEHDDDDEQHLWLAKTHHGLPIKMRFVDKKGRAADIMMTDWNETP